MLIIKTRLLKTLILDVICHLISLVMFNFSVSLCLKLVSVFLPFLIDSSTAS